MKTLKERREVYHNYFPPIEGYDRRKDNFYLKNTCPCCGYPTLTNRYSWEICSICSWEDDGQDDIDADEIYGGPNSDYSLTKYREEYLNNIEIIFTNSNHDEIFLKIKDSFYLIEKLEIILKIILMI